MEGLGDGVQHFYELFFDRELQDFVENVDVHVFFFEVFDAEHGAAQAVLDYLFQAVSLLKREHQMLFHCLHWILTLQTNFV